MKRKSEDKGGSRSFKKFKKVNNNQQKSTQNLNQGKKPFYQKFNNQLIALKKDVENDSSVSAVKCLKRKANDGEERNQLPVKIRKLENDVVKKPGLEAAPEINSVVSKKKPSKKNKYKKLSPDAIPENTSKGTTQSSSMNVEVKSDSNGQKKSEDGTKNFPKNKEQDGKTKTNFRKFAKSKLNGKFKTINQAQETQNNKEKPVENEIWFDDVDEILIQATKTKSNDLKSLVKPNSNTEITKAVAMDCEMVGIGWKGEDSMLARVSIVNQFGHCLYDKFVRPREKVVDYRTKVSGVRPSDLVKGEQFSVVQKEVYSIIKGKVLVGHSIRNDLKVLFLDHPHKMIRDTSQFKPFRAIKNGGTPSLKKLSEEVLGVKIQEGEHNSVQDAQAAMRLYTMYKKKWEASIREKRFKKKMPAHVSAETSKTDNEMEFYD